MEFPNLDLFAQHNDLQWPRTQHKIMTPVITRHIITNFTDKSVRRGNSGQMLLLPALLLHVPLKHPVPQFMDSAEQITNNNSSPCAQALGCGSDGTMEPSRVTLQRECPVPCGQLLLSLCPLLTIPEPQHSQDRAENPKEDSANGKKRDGVVYYYQYYYYCHFSFECMNKWRREAEHIFSLTVPVSSCRTNDRSSAGTQKDLCG